MAECHRPILRTIHIRRHGGRSIGRAHGSGNPGLFSGMVGQKLVRHFSGQTRRRQIHLPHRPLETIIGLGDGRGVERIRFNDPSPRLQILPVNPANHIRTGDHQNVVVSLQIFPMGGETFPAEIFLRQLMALNHGSHRPVHQHDPLRQGFFQLASSNEHTFLHFHSPTLPKPF